MNWTAYQTPIERNVPLPKGGAHSRYPWRDMRVGDSFLVRCEFKDRAKLWSTLTSCKKYATMKTGFKFAIRALDEGLRVWRIS